MTLIGYMRVSTKKQDTLLQSDALRAAGVSSENIYKDVLSGKTTSRDGLDACLSRLKEGDTLIVWRLDRLGRSVKHLLETVEDLRGRGVGFKSLMDPVDTTSASGELVFHIFCAMAQFERSLASERIRAGIKSSMDAGRDSWGRRPSQPYDAAQVTHLSRSGVSKAEIARRLGISLSTVRRALAR